jgi:hypothetical protein
MPFLLTCVDRFMILRWTGSPTVDDVEKIAIETASAARLSSKPLVAIGIVPTHNPMPGTEVRALMAKRWPDLMKHCGRMLLVMEGDGVAASLLRTFLRGMVMVARVQGVTIHESPDDALAALRTFAGPEVLRTVARELHPRIGSTAAN